MTHQTQQHQQQQPPKSQPKAANNPVLETIHITNHCVLVPRCDYEYLQWKTAILNDFTQNKYWSDVSRISILSELFVGFMNSDIYHQRCGEDSAYSQHIQKLHTSLIDLLSS